MQEELRAEQPPQTLKTREAPGVAGGPTGAPAVLTIPPPAPRRRGRLAQLGLAALLALAAGLVALAGHPGGAPTGTAPETSPARVVLGLLAVLVLPGYALTTLVFPRARDLDRFERTALAAGLSLVQIPLVVLALDRSPWGLSPASTILSGAALTWLWCLLAGVRIARWPAGAARAAPGPWPARLAPLTGLVPLPRPGRNRWEGAAVLACVGLAGIVVWTLLTAMTRPALPPVTEFFVLGQGGLAEDFRHTAAPGEPVEVTLGITNREGQPAEYRAVVRQGNEELTQTPPVRVEPGETWRGTVSFALRGYGFAQRVELLLFRAGAAQPYRRLQLVIDVPPPGEPTPIRALQTPVPRR